jgi:hypothetical protein
VAEAINKSEGKQRADVCFSRACVRVARTDLNDVSLPVCVDGAWITSC